MPSTSAIDHPAIVPTANVKGVGLSGDPAHVTVNAMGRSRLTTICIALMQIFALALWSVSAAQSRAGGTMPITSAMVEVSRKTAEVERPCPGVMDASHCPFDCCHHHCDNLAACLGLAGPAMAIVSSASAAETVVLTAASGRFPPFGLVPAGQSVPPPTPPPNG